MRAYWAIFRARFYLLLQYRVAALAGVGTQVFFGLVAIMVMQAFYAGSTRAQPMALEQVVTYKWLGQAFLALLPWSVDREVAAMIKSGAVAYELTRPADVYWGSLFSYHLYLSYLCALQNCTIKIVDARSQ